MHPIAARRNLQLAVLAANRRTPPASPAAEDEPRVMMHVRDSDAPDVPQRPDKRRRDSLSVQPPDGRRVHDDLLASRSVELLDPPSGLCAYARGRADRQEAVRLLKERAPEREYLPFLQRSVSAADFVTLKGLRDSLVTDVIRTCLYAIKNTGSHGCHELLNWIIARTSSHRVPDVEKLRDRASQAYLGGVGFEHVEIDND